jgi:two-component system OmpR family sensor kinase
MSLKRSLVIAFFLLLTLVGLSAAIYAYRAAKQEAWNLLDLQQQQISRFIGDGRAILQGDIGLPPHDSDEDYIIRIQYSDGRAPIQSNMQLTFPAHTKDGFQEYTDSGGTWRIYTNRSATRTVSVAQKITERDELATDAAFNTALPFFFALPWAWAVVYWIVGSIITRIEKIAHQVETRKPDDSTMLPVDSAPVEIRPLVTATNNAFQRLNEALQQQKAFLANAAHELRTPLAALSIQASNLAGAKTTAEWQARSNDVETGIARLTDLTNQLLQLARQDAAGPTDHDTKTDLQAAILETVSTLHPLAHNKEIDLGVDAPDRIDIAANSRDLGVMLQAIMHNAIHYCHEGGQVDITLAGQVSAALITVTDTGPGIPEDKMTAVFERFVRAAEPAKPGSGLGLAIARTIVDRLGGSITLANRKDRTGLVVAIVLPI